MEHGRRIQQLRIEGQPLPLPNQGAPEIDARGVLKQKIALGVTNELRCCARQLAVGQLDVRNHLLGERAAGAKAERQCASAGAGRGEIVSARHSVFACHGCSPGFGLGP